MKTECKTIFKCSVMKKENDNNRKPEIPPWLLSGIMSLNDIIDIIIQNSNYDPQTVKVAMLEFQKVLYGKLKEGYSVKSTFGTFYPHFDEVNPITGNKEFKVEFVPTKEMLIKIEDRKQQRLNNISLN
jgi:predicted transcriptional regulator